MNARDIYSILRRPVVTEKTAILKEDNNQMVLRVRSDANKIEIRKAVEKLMGVSVTNVNTSIQRGKKKRLGKSIGKRSNWKKAVVTLAAGETVEFYEALESLDELEAPEE